jgi:hypothetical protein
MRVVRMGTRYGLAPRWNSSLGDKKLIVRTLEDVVPDILPKKRGQPPKHPIKKYAILIILKESKHASLRDAETDWSEYVCGEHVDHSVIHYWERNIPAGIIEEAIRSAGKKLEEILGYDFSVIDATAFTTWRNNTHGFHLLNRVHEGTVYPVSIARDTYDPIPNTRDTVVPGEGFFMGDKWYDVNGVFRIAYERGYVPLISPQRTRGSGYWRRRGRKVYAKEWRKYRQRGRGESVFGSLTSWLGDRLHTRKRITTYLRSCARVLCYQVRILIRTRNGSCLMVIWMNS